MSQSKASLLDIANGNRGLQYAESYEYNPNVWERFLDKLPGVGGKRAYDRAGDYWSKVHYNPEDIIENIKQLQSGADVNSQAARYQLEEDDRTVVDRFQERQFVRAQDDPTNYGYRNVMEDENLSMINQYISGSPAGHVVETDDTSDYAVDPYNIVKQQAGKSFLGIPIGGWGGSIKQNPGIGAYIDESYFKNQVAQTGDAFGFGTGRGLK